MVEFQGCNLKQPGFRLGYNPVLHFLQTIVDPVFHYQNLPHPMSLPHFLFPWDLWPTLSLSSASLHSFHSHPHPVSCHTNPVFPWFLPSIPFDGPSAVDCCRPSGSARTSAQRRDGSSAHWRSHTRSTQRSSCAALIWWANVTMRSVHGEWHDITVDSWQHHSSAHSQLVVKGN